MERTSELIYLNQGEQVDISNETSTWTRVAVLRVMILWILLVAWGGWVCIFSPSFNEILMALRISAVVGSILNVLNWLPYPHNEDNVCRLAWVGRLFGNYAIPFAVSLTSGIFAR